MPDVDRVWQARFQAILLINLCVWLGKLSAYIYGDWVNRGDDYYCQQYVNNYGNNNGGGYV